ncbi:hypothetical protein E2562_013207, partial [Oryza meyeriana var. granulata]
YWSKLKSMVQTRSHPEGSIAEGYVLDESLTFCSQYLRGCQTRFSRTTYEDRDDTATHCIEFSHLRRVGRPLLGSSMIELDHVSWMQAHHYVLINCEEVAPYIKKHHQFLSLGKRLRKRDVERIHHETFHIWFTEHVSCGQVYYYQQMYIVFLIWLINIIRFRNCFPIYSIEIHKEIIVLANKPYRVACKYNSYAINGYKFQTESSNKGKSTQNFGVAVVASTSSFSSAQDNNPVIGEVTYYGIIKEIIELNYSNKGSVVFKCDWVDIVQGRGIQKDKYGITLVNFTNFIASLVKGGHITLQEKDWRLVRDKDIIWKTIIQYCDIDPICEEWVLASAGKKWRDFKNTLKKRAESYLATHKKQNGEAVSASCKENIDQIERRLEEDETLRLKLADGGDFPIKNQYGFGKKAGREVMLRNIGGSNIVAHGRLQCTDKTAIGVDGLALGIFYELLIDVVLDKNVAFPRPLHKATKLGSVVGLCIAWPHQNFWDLMAHKITVLGSYGSQLSVIRCAL